MKKQLFITPMLLVAAGLLCMILLTGCAPAVEMQPTEATAQAAALPTGTFTNADGNVEFTWNLESPRDLGPMPVVEVKPDFLTGEDMKKICEGILGDAEFYDLGPATQRVYSKEEIQRKIDIMGLYSDQESLSKLWSYSDDNAAILGEHRQMLDFWKQKLETAPGENNLKPCGWQIRNEKFYDDYMEDEGYETLRATANVGGIDYHCNLLLQQEETEYRNVSNWMLLGLGDGTEYTSSSVDRHFRSQLCASGEPTREQYEAVIQKAQAMLDEMGMGNYKAVNPRYDPNYFADREHFEIYVDVMPVFEGVPALAGHLGQNFAQYGPTRGMFSFSANGDFIHFTLNCPVEQTAVLDPAAQPMALSELLNKAQAQMIQYGPMNLAGTISLWQYDPADLTCKVSITGLDYGLARCSTEDGERFVYTPAILCKGTVEYFDKTTGEFLASTDRSSMGIGQTPLVVINALDGSVI